MSERIERLLGQMSLAEKIGQMCQVHGASGDFGDLVRSGGVGSFLNVVEPERANALQRQAVEESRLGIPLLLGRDVIHGFRTVFPIPLGQAASWDPELVEEAARIAAREARAFGVNWTFAPMVDVTREPRWGRVAEGGGEDPVLTAAMGAAMVRGFQSAGVAACAKHYCGYGAAEGGRDYNTTWIPESLLRNVYLPPFRACVEAGALTVMSAFNEINGVPATGNVHTLREILQGEWGFSGFVVSDWSSVAEMVVHGFAADEAEAARLAVQAGVHMEMVSTTFRDHLEALIRNGLIPAELVDDAVRRILQVKEALGLFESPYVDPEEHRRVVLTEAHRETARQLARESCVLLKNDGELLPLGSEVRRIAVLGPLADAPEDQMGCWVMDGRAEEVITPLAALRSALGPGQEVLYAPGLETSRSTDRRGFQDALAALEAADVGLVFLGEEAVLSGEAHCRAFLDLPGAQAELVRTLREVGKPLIGIVLAGRPLVLSGMIELLDACLYAWHPGTMGGPAIVDLLFGHESPSGRLPITFPRAVGQLPIYYAHKNTGRPPRPDAPPIPTGTPLDPVGFFSGYLDVDPTPLFPFGYGLSYTRFEYSDLHLSTKRLSGDEPLIVQVKVRNVGSRAGTEVVQLYIRDLVGSLTRPVRELKAFRRVRLEPDASEIVRFELRPEQLGFYDNEGAFRLEPGVFHLWVGPSCVKGLRETFELPG
ncbi:MAG: beta-glucosidase [Candidatus Poribacteria bacterium]|nr:MAG: beta-glucosidase [Candidatus Poribacteria bacterium]